MKIMDTRPGIRHVQPGVTNNAPQITLEPIFESSAAPPIQALMS